MKFMFQVMPVREELKIMQKLVKPKYFIPVHGEQKHLRKHADLAMFLGMERKNIYIGDVGSVLEINEDYMKELPPVQAGKVFVDGLGVGDVGSIVLRDRKHLGQDGLIIIVASLDVYDGHVISDLILFQEDLYMFVRAKDFLKRSSRPLLQFLRIVQRIMFTNGALLRTESRMMFQNLSVSVQGELR